VASQLASVGYLIGAAGITFPGEIAKGVSFASVNSEGTPLRAAHARAPNPNPKPQPYP
jgi:hypothetical protein